MSRRNIRASGSTCRTMMSDERAIVARRLAAAALRRDNVPTSSHCTAVVADEQTKRGDFWPANNECTTSRRRPVTRVVACEARYLRASGEQENRAAVSKAAVRVQFSRLRRGSFLRLFCAAGSSPRTYSGHRRLRSFPRRSDEQSPVAQFDKVANYSCY